jgi:hypothetical protein
MKPYLEPFYVPEGQRQKVKEESPFRFSGKGYKLAFLIGVCSPVDIDFGFRQPVINDLAVSLKVVYKKDTNDLPEKIIYIFIAYLGKRASSTCLSLFSAF